MSSVVEIEAPGGVTPRSSYRLAWILLGASLICPTFGEATTGAYSPFAFYVLSYVIAPELMPSFRDGMNPLRVWIFTLAVFSNVVFLLAPYLRRCGRVAMSSRALLVASLAVDLAAGLVLRDFTKAPGYWLWLASIATLAWMFVALPNPQAAPASGPTAPPRGRRRTASVPETGAVPLAIWVGLAWTLFWLAVASVNYAHPFVAASATRAGGLAPHALISYFTDETQLFTRDDIDRYNALLGRFEKDTSNQIAVAVYPDAPDGALEEFTIRTADLSRLGRKGLDNGAILFVFAKPRLARLEIGYGLESVINDGKAGSRLDASFIPAWQRGERTQAIDATLAALFDDVRGEYSGGAMPGRVRVLARQIIVEVPKAARVVWPAVRSTTLSVRIAVAFFGSLIGMGLLDAFRQTMGIGRNAVRAVKNLSSRRPLTKGFERVRIDSIVDTFKVIGIILAGIAAVVGVVIVAGGGAFGGGGALRHW